jgi:TldD protein
MKGKAMTYSRIAGRILSSLILCSLLAPAVAQAQAKPRDSKDDAVLSAMRTELERSKANLKMEQVDAPYYIEYRIFDVDGYSAEASFGALRSDVRARIRFVRVVVRIGDYKQDSYFRQGEGTISIMPVDDDLLTLRYELWQATDRAYKSAAESLTAKQSQLKQLTVDQPVDDFAHADPVQSVAPLAKLEIDPAPWRKMLQDASAVYTSDPLLETSESNLSFQAVNEYFVNSEGTVLRNGRTLYEMYLSFTTQASDGMSLARSKGYATDSMRELPTADEFTAHATKLAGTLKELRDAPLVDEEYRGPVLFSADAAADVFADLVGENVLGRRPEPGKNVRTTGAFASSYKTRVLPDFLSVISDPTISSYQGQSLLGHYENDDEGVRAQRVTVIDKGVLVNYLLGREPIRDFPVSNGHARVAFGSRAGAQSAMAAPVPHNSNLIITSSQPTPKEELKKKLIELCQQRALSYCYYVETFGPKLMPRLLYKVSAKDGTEELVRGGSFGELDVRALRTDLIATGDDVYVDNQPQNIPHAIVAPSILFDELEVKRSNTNKEKLPEYPTPAIGQ